MDKQRELFEAWAEKFGYKTNMVAQQPERFDVKTAIYANGQTRSAWEAWQAAIASVVVELPYESFGVTDSEIKKALDKAGIKWTE